MLVAIMTVGIKIYGIPAGQGIRARLETVGGSKIGTRLVLRITVRILRVSTSSGGSFCICGTRQGIPVRIRVTKILWIPSGQRIDLLVEAIGGPKVAAAAAAAAAVGRDTAGAASSRAIGIGRSGCPCTMAGSTVAERARCLAGLSRGFGLFLLRFSKVHRMATRNIDGIVLDPVVLYVRLGLASLKQCQKAVTLLFVAATGNTNIIICAVVVAPAWIVILGVLHHPLVWLFGWLVSGSVREIRTRQGKKAKGSYRL